MADQLASGAVTKEQAEGLAEFFGVIPAQERLQLETALTADPRLIPFVLDNIGKKIRAVESGDMDVWKWVVADELKQLDELEQTRHADS